MIISRAFRFTALCSFWLWPAALLAQSSPSAPPTPPAQAGSPAHAGLIEEFGFLTIQEASRSYRLEVAIVRPATATGRLPVALITHGKQRDAAEMSRMRAAVMLPQARDLAHRGYLAVAVVRRGFGRSDGTPGIAENAKYVNCSVADLKRYFEVEAEQLEGALRAVVARPDADATRVIAIGSSVGGGAMLALAARKPPGLVAAVNIAGGVRLTDAQRTLICPFDTPIAALASFGAKTKIPTLWIYSENDGTFSPDIARRAQAAFRAAGGFAQLRIVPALAQDGHHTFELPEGRVHWLAALDGFLRERGLPTWSNAQVERIMRAARIAPTGRPMLEKYFSLWTPKVLIQAPSGTVSFSANTRGIAQAREAALSECEKRSGAPCRVIVENFEPVVENAGKAVPARAAR